MTGKRRAAATSAVAVTVALVVGCTGVDDPGEQAAADVEPVEVEAAVPAPGLGPAPAPEAASDPAPVVEPGAEGTAPSDPATGVEAYDASISRAFDGVRRAFVSGGVEAGVTALATLTSQQLSREELLACLLVSDADLELQRDDPVSDWRWEYLRRDEGWEVFGRTSVDDAWRPYLVDHTVTIAWAVEGRSGQDISSGTAHVTVTDDNEVVWYPACR